jgi:1-acyl-sn-glycerol-3-phosphate acyltransferase
VGLFTINRSRYVDCDYSEYLGACSSTDELPISTVVCNHLGWFEILNLIMSPLHPAFTPKIEVKSMPLIGPLAQGLQSLYVPRADPADRKKVLEVIKARMDSIENG